MSGQSLRMWTVYKNPSDYPGKFVVRCSRVNAGQFAEGSGGARAKA